MSSTRCALRTAFFAAICALASIRSLSQRLRQQSALALVRVRVTRQTHLPVCGYTTNSSNRNSLLGLYTHMGIKKCRAESDYANKLFRRFSSRASSSANLSAITSAPLARNSISLNCFSSAESALSQEGTTFVDSPNA